MEVTVEAAGMHRLRHFACDFLVGTEPSCRCPHLSCHEDMPPSPWPCVPHEQSPFSCNTEALPGGVLISALHLVPNPSSPSSSRYISRPSGRPECGSHITESVLCAQCHALATIPAQWDDAGSVLCWLIRPARTGEQHGPKRPG